MRLQALLLLPLFSLTCGSCSDSTSPKIDISPQINKQLQTNPKQPIDLALLGPDSWQKVCVLTPYIGKERASKILGFQWQNLDETSIANYDHETLLAFVEEQEVVAFAEYPRSQGDFSKLEPPCLTRADAKVIREPNPKKPEGIVFLVKDQP